MNDSVNKLIWHRFLSVGHLNPTKGFQDFDMYGIYSANEGDITLHENPMDPVFQDILKSLGFKTNTLFCLSNHVSNTSDPIEVAAKIRKYVKNHSITYFDTFITTFFEEKIAKAINLITYEKAEQVVERDSKSDFVNTVQNIIKTPASRTNITDIFSLRIFVALYLFRYGEVVIKEDFGVGGKGLLRLRREDIFKFIYDTDINCLSTRTMQTRRSPSFLVQKWIKNADFSPGVQIFIHTNGDIDINFVCVQRFFQNDIVYKGCLNESWLGVSLRNKLRSEAVLIGKQYFQSGYRGRVGLDAVVKNEHIFWIEANLRKIMSSYSYDFVQNVYENTDEIWYMTDVITLRNKSNWCLSHILKLLRGQLLCRNQSGAFPIMSYNLKELGQFTMLYVSTKSTQECIDLHCNIKKIFNT